MQNFLKQIKEYIKSLTKRQKIIALIVLISSAVLAVVMAALTEVLIYS